MVTDTQKIKKKLGGCSNICEKNAHQFNMSCPKRKTTQACILGLLYPHLDMI